MLDAFEEAKDARFSAGAMRAIGLDAGATLAVERARAQLARSIRATSDVRGGEDALLACVLAGYPDRVARRVRGRSLALGGGGSAELAESSAVRDALWMVAVDAEERGRGISVRTASAIEPEWLIDAFSDRIVERREATWNAQAERVESVERMEYDGLALHESSSPPPAEDAARVLAEAALRKGARAFAPSDALDAWLARARFAATATGAPPPGDEDVRAALVELCEGKSSFAELRDAGLLDLLKARSPLARRLDALAPERIAIANGRTAEVHYEEGKSPWLEAYLQDFFGMLATPKVGDARVPIVLHLLAPNKRAVQVTSDLEGFWERHYPAIRKELMRKYPKHNWPEDPKKPGPRFTREIRR
jgi:ATP-dependent helicase HrpB